MEDLLFFDLCQLVGKRSQVISGGKKERKTVKFLKNQLIFFLNNATLSKHRKFIFDKNSFKKRSNNLNIRRKN